MLKKHFPICIPIRTTAPYPYKDDVNLDCLKLLTNTFKKNNVPLTDCIIILDGRGYEIFSLAQKLGYENFYVQDYASIDDLQEQNKYVSEWTAITDMLNNMCLRDKVYSEYYNGENINRKPFIFDFDFSHVFVAQISSPFKSFKFMEEVSFWKIWEQMDKENISFLTSASYIKDMSMFYINNAVCFQKSTFSDDYFTEGTIRNINKCPKELYCNNVWYFINTDFLKNKVVTAHGIKQTRDDQYLNFWNESNFSVIVDNTQPQIFINNNDDFKKLKQIVELCNI